MFASPTVSRLCQGYARDSIRPPSPRSVDEPRVACCGDWHVRCRRPGASHRRPLRGSRRRRHRAPSRIGGVRRRRPGPTRSPGSGENVWGTADAFQFVWTKLEGDVAIEADVAFVGAGKNAHRKAMLMIRQGLEADAAYVDAAVHGDGLTSIQFRAAKGGPTQEVQSNVAGPARVRIERQGDYARLYVAEAGAAAALLRRRRPRRVQRSRSTSGSGSARTTRTKSSRRRFSNVDGRRRSPRRRKPPVLYSTLETVPLGTGSTDRRVQYVSTTRFEAPNWYPDGKAGWSTRAASC